MTDVGDNCHDVKTCRSFGRCRLTGGPLADCDKDPDTVLPSPREIASGLIDQYRKEAAQGQPVEHLLANAIPDELRELARQLLEGEDPRTLRLEEALRRVRRDRREPDKIIAEVNTALGARHCKCALSGADPTRDHLRCVHSAECARRIQRCGSHGPYAGTVCPACASLMEGEAEATADHVPEHLHAVIYAALRRTQGQDDMTQAAEAARAVRDTILTLLAPFNPPSTASQPPVGSGNPDDQRVSGAPAPRSLAEEA